MGLSSSKTESTMDKTQIKENVLETISNNKIVMFSKAYCPYCVKAKGALDKLTSDYLIIELNGHPQGSQIQEILGDLTGGRTVPRVFINGKFIGGGDDTVRLYQTGELAKLIK